MNSASSSRSQRGYDRLALSYRATEWLVFGQQLQRARVAMVNELPPWNRLLILGDGNGRLLEQLCVRQLRFATERSSGDAPSRITSLDHSPRMLRLQRARVESIHAAEYVEFIQADACGYKPEVGAYDVVVTPFFLDCFSLAELESHLPRWMEALRVGGTLLYVDFLVPQSPWQRPRAKLLLWAMHLYFRWQTGLANRQLVDTRPLIEQCGMRMEREQIGGGGMLTAQLWRFTP
ncbi:MAG: class I SAM-dependent methyltransferase [Planctomycetales bacterium]|nr:class I SAM-dependent methyltransferase [Planctomycetales bacterium]